MAGSGVVAAAAVMVVVSVEDASVAAADAGGACGSWMPIAASSSVIWSDVAAGLEPSVPGMSLAFLSSSDCALLIVASGSSVAFADVDTEGLAISAARASAV